MRPYFVLIKVTLVSAVVLAIVDFLLAANVTEQTCINVALSETTFTKYLTLKKSSSLCVYVEKIPRDTRYFIIQVHAQRTNLTLSYENSPNRTGSSVSGTSIGLVSNALIVKSPEEIFWIFNINSEDTAALLSIVQYKENDPIPGGCNMEFPIEISPFMRVRFNHVDTKLQFQLSNIGYPPKTSPPLCSRVSGFLSYKLYVYFLPENDFSEKSLFHGLELMRNVSSIRSNSQEVKPYKIAPKTQTVLLAYPGQGAIYSIIVHYQKNGISTDAAYVPVLTYGCSFESKVDGCGHLTSSFAQVFALIMAVLGILICLRGHHFLTLEMAYFGFLVFALIAFIFLTRFTALKTNDRDVLTMVVGVIGAISWASVWWFFGIPVISTLLVGLVLGFILAAIMLFTPVGEYELLRNNTNYWLIISSGMLIVPILLLTTTRLLNILASSVVGAYGTLIACDRYIGTTLSYIVLNVVKRAVVEDLYLASNAYPFQTNDIILCVVWVVLAIIGVAIQLYTERKRAPFPPTPYKVWKQSRQLHRERVHRQRSMGRPVDRATVNERTPLLQSTDTGNPVHYSTNYLGTI